MNDPPPAPADSKKEKNKDQSAEDIRIQGKIADLTFWLVIFGGVQALALIGTGVVVCRQAGLMKVHAEHLSGLAVAASANASSIARQAALMNRQNTISISSARTARDSADAAKKSAEASLAQINAMKSKERARIWIATNGDLNLGFQPFSIPVEYVIKQTGPTDAFIIDSAAGVVVSDDVPEYSQYFSSINIPNRVPPNYEESIKTPFLRQFTKDDVPRVEAKAASAYFIARISYQDIFGEIHETNVMRKWHITDLKNIMGYGNFAYWAPCGPPEANRET
jgi:hypothetical protein